MVRPSQQAGAGQGHSPQRSQHCPSGRRASWQAAKGQRLPRGWSRAAQIHGCTWGREAGSARRGRRADCGEACARGGKRARDGWAMRPTAQPRPPAQRPAPPLNGALAAPLQAALTSALPQTQPDGSTQASESTLSAPGPWKRRRPARDSRKAVRSSLSVYFCGGRVASEANARRRQHWKCSEPKSPERRDGRNSRGGPCQGKGAELRP